MVAHWAKLAKYKYLVMTNWGASAKFWSSPHVQGPIPTSKPQISPTNKFSLFKQNRLNLEVWWFEIRAPVKFWCPQNDGGPIPPLNPQIANIHQQILTLQAKRLNIDILWFEIKAPGNSKVPHTFAAQFPLLNLKFKTRIHRFWFIKQNMLNLDVWWFNNPTLVELRGTPSLRTQILPSNARIFNTNNEIFIQIRNYTNFRCLVI
jgi:hypothetical protein